MPPPARTLALRLLFLPAALASTFAALPALADSQPKAADIVKPELLADVTAVEPGKTFTLGVLLRVQPHWHVYWLNPGDSGMPARATFELPPGFKVSDLHYPVPTKFLQPGDLVAYGYAGEVLLTATVTPPHDLPSCGTVPIHATLKYLVCNDVCLPGTAPLSLELPINLEAEPAHADLFSRFLPQVPLTGPAADAVADVKTAGRLTPKPSTFTLNLHWKQPADNVEFFPGPSKSINIHDIIVTNKGPNTRITFVADLLQGQQPDLDALTGVVVYTDEQGTRRGLEFPVPLNPDLSSKSRKK